MSFAKLLPAAAGFTAMLLAGAGSAEAKCTRLAYSVNDYGKEGPTRDAKALLDTYIAKWTAERGITKFTVGKKDVSCELFLDFGFFDEHTCKAAATVCWPESQRPARAAAPGAARDKQASGPSPATTGSLAPPKPKKAE